MNITNFKNYLNKLTPENIDTKNLETSTKGRWGYFNKHVTFFKNPQDTESKKIQSALINIHEELNHFSGQINGTRNENSNEPISQKDLVACQRKLSDLRILVNTKVDHYYNKHNSFFGKIYVFFQKCKFGDANKIRNKILEDIQILEKQMSPSLDLSNEKVLPVSTDAFREILTHLSVNDLKNLDEAHKSFQAPISDLWVSKAQKFGYKGDDRHKAKQYMASLQKALNFGHEQGFSKTAVTENNIEKVLINNLKKISIVILANFIPSLGNKYSQINTGNYEEDKHLKVLAQFYLHAIQKFEDEGGVLNTNYLTSVDKLILNHTLRRAVAREDLEIVELALKCGANDPTILLSDSCEKGWRHGTLTYELIFQPIFCMAFQKDIRVFELLLKHGNLSVGDINALLFKAVYTGRKDIMNLLMSYGADINIARLDGNSLLMYAATYNRKGMVQDLIDAMYIDDNSENLGSALFIACTRQHDDFAQMLIDKGAEMNFCGPEGIPTFAGFFVSGPYKNSQLSEEAMNFLIENGADIEAKDNEGHTALTYLLNRGDFKQAEKLLKLGANINQTNNENETILQHFSKMKDRNVVDWLKKHRAM